MNQNKSKYYRNSINKEFLSVFFIITTPTLAFFEGYGIKTIQIFFKDFYYYVPVIYGFYMNYKNKNKIINKYLFILLLVFALLKNCPLLYIDKYFNGNFLMLLISDIVIIIYYLLLTISFWKNNPFFVTYYKSNLNLYILIYKIISIYFFSICIALVIFFIRIYLILKETYF